MQAQWLSSLSRFTKQNSPTILSGIAVGGVIATVILAVRATPKAVEAIAQARDDKALEEVRRHELDNDTVLSVPEIVKCSWKFYLPAALSGAATVACIVGANTLGARRYAALAGAYTLVDTTFREYKDKVVEQIGAVKAQKVTDAIQQAQLEENPPVASQVIITGGGEVLCRDSLTGRYFQSDIERIRKAQNDLNASVIRDMYASQNDFYSLLGLDHVAVGDELGWNLENLMELTFTTLLAEGNKPCLAIGYQRLPRKDYGKF